MKLMLAVISVALLLSACGKLGAGGVANRVFGNWAEVRLPKDCVAKNIAGEEASGVIVLCEDGRIFH